MLPDAPVFAVFLAAVVALTLTPGPDMIYLASRALGQGRAGGVLSAFGGITGTFVHLGLAALGLAERFHHAPWAYDLVRTLGAAYLLYLAWRVARRPRRSGLCRRAGGSRRARTHLSPRPDHRPARPQGGTVLSYANSPRSWPVSRSASRCPRTDNMEPRHHG